jgi:hypothetical protein
MLARPVLDSRRMCSRSRSRSPALQYVEPERIHLTSDCGLFAYARPAAKAKLRAMVKGADLVRNTGARRSSVGAGLQTVQLGV